MNCPSGYGTNANGAGCYCGPGQTPYLVGANPYCIPPPMDQSGNPVYPANASCAHGWDTSAQACVCGPGDAPMSVAGPSGVDCVEPATATYSTGPYAVAIQSQAPPPGGHWVQVSLCDGFGHRTTITFDPPGGAPSLALCWQEIFLAGCPPQVHICDSNDAACIARMQQQAALCDWGLQAGCIDQRSPGQVFTCVYSVAGVVISVASIVLEGGGDVSQLSAAFSGGGVLLSCFPHNSS